MLASCYPQIVSSLLCFPRVETEDPSLTVQYLSFNDQFIEIGQSVENISSSVLVNTLLLGMQYLGSRILPGWRLWY